MEACPLQLNEVQLHRLGQLQNLLARLPHSLLEISEAQPQGTADWVDAEALGPFHGFGPELGRMGCPAFPRLPPGIESGPGLLNPLRQGIS
jgi:hypothetical protein